MRAFNIFFLIAIVSTSCSPIYVNYDYEKGTDFTQYKTYNYFSSTQTGLSELDTKRLLNALDLGLKNKGLALSGTPDFYIDIRSNEFRLDQRNTVGVGVGGTGRNIGGGISVGIPIGQNNIERQITIDFVDEKRNGLFWQAITEASFNPNAQPERKESQIKVLVEKVLSKYPPKK